MPYQVQIVADSLSSEGKRLTSMLVSFPRIVLAEFNTHRVFSRNTASSRAIPVAKIMDRVMTDPFIPSYWGKAQKGMEASQQIPDEDRPKASAIWLESRDLMLGKAKELMDLGVHKQITNRLLEPWLYTTVLVTSTSFRNFFHLRNNPKAQPEIRTIAAMMQEAYLNSVSSFKGEGEWHLPFLRPEDLNWDADQIRKILTARCARLSYMTHDGKRDPFDDLRLHDDLARDEHWSPFEHIATPCVGRHGNFDGWKQYRQMVDLASYT